MSKPSSKSKTEHKAQNADDILSSLMDDLKDVDVEGTSLGFQNELGLDPELLKNIRAPHKAEDDVLLIDADDIRPLTEHIEKMEPNIDMDAGSADDLVGAGDPFEVTRGHQPMTNMNVNKKPAAERSLFDNLPTVEGQKSDGAMPSNSSTPPSTSNLFGSEGSGAPVSENESTVATEPETPEAAVDSGDGERTVAVAGYAKRSAENYDDKVKVSVGQVRGNAFSSGYAAWGSSESNLAQAENLRIAQDKILDLEKDNEKLRSQNEELIAASEIVKERADLLTAQVHEFKSDRDALEQSFKSETSILKAQMTRKDAEIVKASMKIEELESRMKFDLKKIRVRERELENRLELIRAEKNALVKTKDEQILDLRRKLDQVQLEVESYRQKCVDLNKVIDTNNESFKRTTRALRLAMANLELQEENKTPLKKVD